MIRSNLLTAACVLVGCLGDPSGSALAQSISTSPQSHVSNSQNQTNSSFDDVINHDNDSVNNSGNDRGNTKSYNSTTKNSNNSTTRRSNNTRNSNNTSTTTTNNVSTRAGDLYQNDQRVIIRDEREHSPVPTPVGPAAADSVPVLSFYYQRDTVGDVYGASISIPLH